MTYKIYDEESRYNQVMNSIPHAKLFYELQQRPSYPQKLCKKFKVDCATMGERLNNLLELGFIRKKTKMGRKQYYEADWNRIMKLHEREMERLEPFTLREYLYRIRNGW